MSSKGLYGLLLLLPLLFNDGASQTIIKSLPGYSGSLPFKLETGYIGVGENDEIQLFYYFVESKGNPSSDPVLVWLTGGPGCSGLFGVVYDIGPCTFDTDNYNGGLPSILLNSHSWAKVANVIFMDMPVGTGFSYVNTSQSYYPTDTTTAKDIYTFLRKWLLNHPKFIKNHIYVSGESYGGKLAPMVSMEILQGNKAGLQPQMAFQGYIIGNGLTDPSIDFDARIPYAYGMALISKEYYEFAKLSCDGKYYNNDPNNLQCSYAIQQIAECLKYVNRAHILYPKCDSSVSKPAYFGWNQTLSMDNSVDHLLLPTEEEKCHEIDYIVAASWANDPTVREALHVRKGTVKNWTMCYYDIPYEQNVESALEYHKNFTQKGFHVNALVFNGDHDMSAPYLGPLSWIPLLNLTVDDKWRAWIVNGQVGGFTEKYKKNDFHLTFATIKGAGHGASRFKPEQSLQMITRWFSGSPL